MEKADDAFYKRRARCIDCIKEYNVEYRTTYDEQYRKATHRTHLGARFGITVGDYDRMLTAQGGRCAICRGEWGEACS